MKRPGMIPAVFAAVVLALLLATRRDLREPHLRLFSDMMRSPAYHSQQSNPVFRDGKTLQAPVPGTIARDFHPFPYGPGTGERERAGRELKNPFLPSYEVMSRGKRVFEVFCMHCHGRRGLGDGAVAKAFPAFSMPLASKSSFDLPDGTLFHIITYGRNLMPSHASQVDQDDRWKVIYYLRDLQRQEIARLGPNAVVPEDPRRLILVSPAYGKELFAANCAACHGDEGRFPKPGIPTIHSQAVLAIADDAYYWDIINHGRSGTQMPAWKSVLTRTQIQSLIQYFRSWTPTGPDLSKMAALHGDVPHGQAVFTARCAGCHGPEGRGGIGLSLNSKTFLAIASDSFLRETIALGRHHTAMPSSYDLTPQDIGDLVALIRSWSKPSHTFSDVQALLPAASLKAGKDSFQARCAGCHGENGEGGIGSLLHGDDFLAMAGDELLYKVIMEGRPGTEMPSWRFLSAQEAAGLIAFIRSWQKAPAVALSTGTRRGRPEFGEVLYKLECSKCHGVLGEGDLGTQLGNPALLSQLSDDFLWRSTAYGKAGTEMKGFINRPRKPLIGEDIDHIIAFLRQLQRNPPPEDLKRHYSWTSVADGKKVFEQKGGCVKCHGGAGEGGTGPALGNPAFLKAVTEGFLAATIVLGREDTAMKSYTRGGDVRLEQEDIENVVSYIRSFEKTQTKAVRRIDHSPKLAAAGRLLFRENCAKCHGREGLGRHGARPGEFAPSLNNQEFLKAADDNFLLATIALGRPGTPMRGFGDGLEAKPGLSADQVRQIVAFLRSWRNRR